MGRYYETFNPPFFLDLSFLHDYIADNRTGFERDPTSILRDIRLGLSRLHIRDRSEVRITVQDQIVSIDGAVPSQSVSKYIANVANNVLGVRAVKNRLQIKRSGAEAKPQKIGLPKLKSQERLASDSLN